MSDMQHKMAENHDEIVSFITEGTHRLATISTNDYGFQLSARMAQTYLERAIHVLESKQTFDRGLLSDIGKMKVVAEVIADEYAQLEKFCTDCERFNHLKTKNAIEWVSKWVVRLASRRYLRTSSYHLAYKIRTFHSMVCSILIEQ